MKKLTFTTLLVLCALLARSQITYVNLTSLATNVTTSSALITIPGVCTNVVYTVVNSNNIVIGDPIPSAFAEVNSSFSYVSNQLAILSQFPSQVNSNLAAATLLVTTNGVLLETNATCTLVVSNGLSGFWNSNGISTWLRTSQVGSTAWTDTLLKLH